MLIGNDVSVCVVFVWKETGGNSTVWLGDHMTISHADARYWTRVSALRGERVTTTPARQHNYFVFIYYKTWQTYSLNKKHKSKLLILVLAKE